jgi:hypothetical protein
MEWIYLAIIHSFLVVSLIVYIRYDTTPYFILPIIANIIVGILSILYFTYYYKEDFTKEFANPIYYLYSLVFLAITMLSFYIIKNCPNPAYFRIFVALEIILLLLITIYINNIYDISTQTMLGILCGCASILLISLDENNNNKK